MTSDTKLRGLKPRAKAYKHSDGGSLHLLVTTTGGKLWRMNYKIGGKYKTLALGEYPLIGLSLAREKRDDAKRLIASGVDPSQDKQDKRQAAVAESRKEVTAQAETFRITADEWFAKYALNKRAKTVKNIGRLKDVLVSEFKDRPIREVSVHDLLKLLRKVEKLGHHETNSRLRWVASQIFQYGIACTRCDRDIAHDVRAAITKPITVSLPGLTDTADVGEMLRDIDSYQGRFDNLVGLALKLQALVFVRPDELASAPWSEFDLDGAMWIIRKERTKLDRDQMVPLSRQALAVLRQVETLTGKRKFVFSLSRDVPMSDNTLNKALRKLGWDTKTEHCAHGFRTTASTLLNEELGESSNLVWDEDVIELQLAHKIGGVRGTYNRATKLPARVRLMQHWADRLDYLRTGAKVIKLGERA